MAVFASRFTNKVDRKGRVSVPASFRAALGDNVGGIVVLPSFKNQGLEVYGQDRLESMKASLDQLPQYSEQHDTLKAQFALIWPVPIDSEGRIVLPDDLLAHAGITDTASFAGMGSHFEIWEPAALAAHLAEQRDLARTQRLTLPGNRPMAVTP